ncbi:MAG: lyase family protein, partial [Sulfurospirillaceae bacterium]
MGKLWSGRFDKNSSKLLDIFNASLPFDKILYEEDIKGSIAHATMLASQGILTQKEADLICDGLKQIKDEIKEGKFTFDIGDEDIHMSIEKRLIELIGEIGGKLHTARSRNDQVALDFRLYVLKSNKVIMELIKDLIKTLHTLALPHTSTLMPGMTHLQHAQPINFAYHLMAYISMFLRDFKRFEFSSIENSVLPLG